MDIGEIERPNELVDQDLVYSRGSHTKPVTIAFGPREAAEAGRSQFIGPVRPYLYFETDHLDIHSALPPSF